MPTLFEPITVGTMHLDHRIVFPPHSGGRGSLTGTPEQFERYAAYWVERIRGGVQWVGGAPNFIRNPLIPGFEPTGVGASGPGTFRHPLYVERLAELSARIHAAGGYSTVQMVLQGGASPLAPSATLSGYHDHDVPHVLAAERGHQVTLWEQADHLGGQLAVAAKARMNHRYAEWIDWQRRRLDDLGVQVDLGRTATAEDVVAAGADVVVVATGARPRLPRAGGLDAPHVVTGEAALTGTAPVGRRVLVVSEDDRPAPIAIADHLTGAGHEVTMIYRTTAPTRLVHKYAIGAVLARLDTEGATLVPTTRLTRVEGSTAHLANTYSGREWMLEGIDTVVLACGSVSDDALYLALKDAHPNVHRLGDAYAPRRMTFATRQAWSLVATLDR